MTNLVSRRVFIWARESDGNTWDRDESNPPQFTSSGKRTACVISPNSVRNQHFARAKLLSQNGSISLFFPRTRTNIKNLDLNNTENIRLLVPCRLGQEVLRNGITLLNGRDGGFIMSLISDPPSNEWDQNLRSAMDLRGWTLLFQTSRREGLPEVKVTSLSTSLEEAELQATASNDVKYRAPKESTKDAWLNPLVIVFLEKTQIPSLGDFQSFSNSKISKAIKTAQEERYAVMAKMPIHVQRRAIGWQAIWENRQGSALTTLFNRKKQYEYYFTAPFADLALLDSFGGTFLAKRSGEEGPLSWSWIPPNSKTSNDRKQIWEHLCKVLGFESSDETLGCFSRFDWGHEARHATRRPIRVSIKDVSDTVSRLKCLANEVKTSSIGFTVERILSRFADVADGLSLEDAEEIFRPLFDPSTIEGDYLITNEQVLLDEIQARFFAPRSNIYVPLEAATFDEDVDRERYFGTGFMNDKSTVVLDPFRSPRNPLNLMHEVFSSRTGDENVMDEAHFQSPWYDVFRRHVAIGHNNSTFRLVGRTVDGIDRFVLDRSLLDKGRLAAETHA